MNFSVFKWVIFTTIGWITGITLSIIIIHPFEEIGLSIFGIGFCIAIGIGFMQWIILRKYLNQSWKWILYYVSGLGGIFLLLNIIQIILDLFNINFMNDGYSFLIPIVFGASLGGGPPTGRLQEKYIFNKKYNHSKNWAKNLFIAWLVSSSVLVLYFTISIIAEFQKSSIGPLPNILVFICIGPILGLLTGKKIELILKSY